MNHLLEDDDDLMQRRDREVTLSTGAILGIFFGLVLVCGGFFAFGYNLGQKSSATANSLPAPATDNSSAGNFSSFKPSAGSPANSVPTPASQPASAPPPAAAQPAPSDTAATTPASQTAPSAPAVTRQPPAQPTPPAVVTPSPATAAGSFVVQVAAVSHQEDATLLVGALRSKGYSVAAHTQPQDRLIHIQVGPFANRSDAEAMRQRLLGDGYNAIVK